MFAATAWLLAQMGPSEALFSSSIPALTKQFLIVPEDAFSPAIPPKKLLLFDVV